MSSLLAQTPLPELVRSSLHVPGELHARVSEDLPRGQRLLDLDRRVAGFDVNPATTAGLGLEEHVGEVVAVEVERRVEQELPHVALYVRLGAALAAGGKTPADVLDGVGHLGKLTLSPLRRAAE